MSDGRINIIGSCISRCDQAGALDLIMQRLAERRGGYICFANVHSAVTGRNDARFRTVLNHSFLSLADGKAVYWVGQARGAHDLGHVPGPDFMLQLMRRHPERRHYFYGSTPEVLAKLTERLRRNIAGLNIVGSHSPPFRPATDEERQQDFDRIRAARPDFVWVGLGAPKQEFWMAAATEQLAPAILLGVGAAFDFQAGTVRRAPEWMRDLGFEWLHRLGQEPRRLWRRYLVTNSLFILYLVRDIFSPVLGTATDD